MAEFNTNAKNAAVSAAIATAKYISLHIADPAGTGVSEVTGGTYARVLITWPATAGGSVTGPGVTINVPASITIVGWGVWDAATGGNFWEGGLLSSSQAFGPSGGTYTLTPTISATG